MTTTRLGLGALEARARRASPEANRHAERLVRLGYAAKATVYFIVGGLAAAAAFNLGGQVADPREALATLADNTWGQVLLAVLGVGLLGYALWRFYQSFADAEGYGTDAKGVVARTGFAVSGAIHLSLAFFAMNLLVGNAQQSQGAQGWTARIMAQPWGTWLVGAAGLIVLGYGVVEAYRGIKEKFTRKLRMTQMSRTERRVTVRAGKVGLVARGIVFAIIGVFLVVAAVQHDPSEARGLGGALGTLAQQPYGPWLLGAVALGLIGYAVYTIMEAFYRRIPSAR